MDNFQKEFIGLIRAALTDKAVTLSPDFDWRKATAVAKDHNISAIIFYGALNCGIPQKCEDIKELDQLTVKTMMVSLRQVYEIEQLEIAFKNEGIEYMPLKGTVLKNLYPKPEMRTMGDADILVNLEQYEKVKEIMDQLDFKFKYESDHELVWEKSSLFLELHKSIMSTYNKDFYSYFGTGWKVAKQLPGSSKYEMSNEDFFIYIFVHFTKHYRISGIGIKHLLDLWVFSHTHPDINWEYIQGELEKMQLGKFYVNVMKTVNVWFEDDAETEESVLITNVIFNSGQYGTADMAVVNRALRDKGKSAFGAKFIKFFKRLFVPYKEMKRKYKILEKIPVLLPVMWVVRWFEIVFIKKDTVKKYMNEMDKINSESIEKNARALHFVGLDFDNE